jgi:DNA invertase Pin-like site-specific DNA recombinase
VITVEFAAIYARASTDKQGDTIDHQVDMIKEFAKRTKIDVMFDDRFIYADEGESGFKTTLLQRPAMKRLMNDIDNGLVTTVFFKGISRFARDSGETITTAKRLINKRIRVLSLEENYDSNRDDPTLFQIFAVLAENESRKTSIRVSLGNKQKARNGLWSGTITPLGYSKVKEIPNEELKKTLLTQGKHNQSLYPNEYAHIVQKIFQMYVKENVGRKKIVAWLNENGYKTNRGKPFQEKHIIDILQNECYIGNIVYGKTRYNYVEDEDKNKKIQQVVYLDEKDWVRTKNAHPAIIENEMFEQAQKKFKENKKSHPKQFNAAKHPLTGLLKCGKCNAPMICQKRTNTKRDGTKLEYRYYVCSTYHKFGRNMCDQTNVVAEDLEGVVFNKLKHTIDNYLKSKWNYKNNTQMKQNRDSNLKNDLKQIETVLQKKMNASKTLLESREFYDLETFISLNSELQNEIKQIRSQKEKIENELNKKSNEEELNLEDYSGMFKSGFPSDLTTRRKVFHKLLVELQVVDKSITRFHSAVDLIYS